MILNTTKEAEALPSLRKAAILLVALGEGSSAQLLQQLNEDEVQKVSREVARMTAITAEQAESVLEEFHHIADAGGYVARGGIEFARKLLMRAFEPDHAKRLLDRLTKALGADAASFDALQKADPQQLAKFIHNEHPQTIALVLSHLSYSQAASLLTSLPAAMRADVSQRMASLDQISPDIILKIAAVIGSKLKALGEFSRESYGGVRAVAEMLNRLDSTSSREILDHIDRQDTNLAETIRHLMFVFEDEHQVANGLGQVGVLLVDVGEDLAAGSRIQPVEHLRHGAHAAVGFAAEFAQGLELLSDHAGDLQNHLR